MNANSTARRGVLPDLLLLSPALPPALPGASDLQNLGGVPLEDLMAEDFAWQEGWEYRLTSFPCTQNPPG